MDQDLTLSTFSMSSIIILLWNVSTEILLSKIYYCVFVYIYIFFFYFTFIFLKRLNLLNHCTLLPNSFKNINVTLLTYKFRVTFTRLHLKFNSPLLSSLLRAAKWSLRQSWQIWPLHNLTFKFKLFQAVIHFPFLVRPKIKCHSRKV